MTFVFPSHDFVGSEFSGLYHRHNTPAPHCTNLVTVEFCWIIGPGQVHKGGHDIRKITRSFFQATGLLYLRRIADDGRGRYSSFVDELLVHAERRIASDTPHLSLTGSGTGRDAFPFLIVCLAILLPRVAERNIFRFGRATVVREEDYHGIFVNALFFEFSYQATDVEIQYFYLSSVDGAAEVKVFAIVGT